MRVLIVGCLGMLGTELMSQFSSGHQVLGMDKEELDITDLQQCITQVQGFRPEVIINAAALTQVDYCETHQEEAFLVNGEGAGNLAKAAASISSLLIHFSTDYIFDGFKKDAYLEEDLPNPCNIYGKSKLRGEELVRQHCPNHLILRTSWLFGRNGSNFLRTIFNIAKQQQSVQVVNDQKGSPSYAKDLASKTLDLVGIGCKYTYHVTNTGSCTWYELAVKAVQWAGMTDINIQPVSTAEFPRPAERPANSILANARLEREGLPLMRSWQEATQEYIKLLCVK